jgi:hypothetical protein
VTNKGSLAESVTIGLIIIIIIIILNHFFPMTLGGYYMKNWKNKVGILKNKLFCGGKFPTLIMCPLDALELFCQCFTTVLFDCSWMYFVPILIHLIFMHAGCETFEEILGNFKPTN